MTQTTENVTLTMSLEEAEFVMSVLYERATKLALAVKNRDRATRFTAMFDQAKCFRAIDTTRCALENYGSETVATCMKIEA